MNRKENNRGAAMVIVLCVMVVFLALSATVILAGSVALTTARNNVIFERGKAQAVSLSELFARDMKRDYTEETSSLLHYVRDAIVTLGWTPYDETADNKDASGVVRKLTMDSGGDTHQIRIEMYWTWDGTGNLTEEQLADQDVRLFVDVISTLSDSEYHIKREFQVDVKKNNDPATSGTYPYLWEGRAMGRSDER